MTRYADNMKKSIVATQKRITQMIHDEIERANAANREAIIRMLEEVGLWRILEVQALLPHLERFADLVAAEEREALKEERLREDAERYRWLREESKKRPDFYSGDAVWMVSCEQGGMGRNFFGEKIDAAIDAAMKEAALRREHV